MMIEPDKYDLEAAELLPVIIWHGEVAVCDPDVCRPAVAAKLRAQDEFNQLKIDHYVKESFENLAELEGENNALKLEIAQLRAQGLEIDKLNDLVITRTTMWHEAMREIDQLKASLDEAEKRGMERGMERFPKEKRIYCRYCGAKLKHDWLGRKCPTANCQWHQGVPKEE